MTLQLPGFERQKRKSPRVMAKLVDAGSSPTIGCKTIALFRCKRCGWDSGWRDDNRPDSQIRRGIPCEECNSKLETNHADQD